MGPYPKQPEKGSGRHVPAGSKADDENCKQESVSNEFFAILGIVAVVKSFVFDSLVQRLVLLCNFSLGLCIQRRIVSSAIGNLLFYC